MAHAMARAQMQTAAETRQYQRQDARCNSILGRALMAGIRTGKIPPDTMAAALSMMSEKDRAFFVDGLPNAETLAAIADPGTRTTLDGIRAMIYEKD